MRNTTRFMKGAGVIPGASLMLLFANGATGPAATADPEIFGVGKPGIEVNYDVLDPLPAQPSLADYYREVYVNDGSPRPWSEPVGTMAAAPVEPVHAVTLAPPAVADLAKPVISVMSSEGTVVAPARTPAVTGAEPKVARAIETGSASSVDDRRARERTTVTLVPTVAGEAVRILFSERQSNFDGVNAVALDRMAETVSGDESMRLALQAYARDLVGDDRRARRLSLLRALSVRSYLIRSGVNSAQIDVRALGSRTGSGPADRVDVQIRKY